jgi:hypothetical protein
VNIELSTEALAFGEAAAKALNQAELPWGVRSIEDAEAALTGLGAWDLSPRDDPDDCEAAAALCRAAGFRGLPLPVAARLAGPGAADDDPLALTLPCWTLLGMTDRALDLTRAHVLAREQFGQPLARFQGVQFQFTDAEVGRAGVEVLAAYALWSIQAGLPEAGEDALALRVAALEAAETLFRVAHQLHGALGFCDEAPLSWLSRGSQEIRRRPFGLSATRTLLMKRAGRRGLTGLFSEPELFCETEPFSEPGEVR